MNNETKKFYRSVAIFFGAIILSVIIGNLTK